MSETTVAMVTPINRKGGIATYSSKLIEQLRKSGVRVAPVPIERPNSANPIRFVELGRSVPSTADLIHVQYEAGLFGRAGMSGVGAPGFFGALGGQSLPVVTTLHEVHAEHPHRGLVGDYLLRWRDLLIERMALRVSEEIVVHTREAERVMAARHDASGVYRLLHPVDADAKSIPPEKAKESIGVEGDTLLTFGWVERKKQYEDVIRALPDLSSTTYVIAGGKREGEGQAVLDSVFELAEEIGVEDRVRYLSYVKEEQVPAVFCAADVVVLPYERVSQSGVVNDALAHGRPVVASKLPAFEELEAEYGCLITYDDENDLEEEVRKVLSNHKTRERLAECTAEYVEAESWGRFAERTARIYANVLRD